MGGSVGFTGNKLFFLGLIYVLTYSVSDYVMIHLGICLRQGGRGFEACKKYQSLDFSKGLKERQVLKSLSHF